MRLSGIHASLSLVLALLAPAPGDARQAPAQLHIESAGCPSGYVHLTGGQCVQMKLARQYRDGDQLDPRATGFRPIRRRGRPWASAWGGPGGAASNPEVRRVPARRVELQQTAEPVEVRRRPEVGANRGRGQRRREPQGRRGGGGGGRGVGGRGGGGRGGGGRGEGGRDRGGRNGGGLRGEAGRRQLAEGEPSAPSPLTADGDAPVTPTTPTCLSGRLDRRGRCRDGRRRGKGGKSRDRVGRRGGGRNQTSDTEPRRRRPRPCRKGFIRIRQGQCVVWRGSPEDGAPTEGSSDAAATQVTRTAELTGGEGRELTGGEELPVEARRQGQRRRGSQGRQRGRRRRPGVPGGRPGGRRGARPDSGQPDSGAQGRQQPDSGSADSGQRTANGRQRTADGRPRGSGRPPCPAGQVPWRRGRCVDADRLQACPGGSQRQPGGRCKAAVRCDRLPLPDTGRCPAGCARTDDACACCQPGLRPPPGSPPDTAPLG